MTLYSDWALLKNKAFFPHARNANTVPSPSVPQEAKLYKTKQFFFISRVISDYEKLQSTE
jgi:hypothetical protein